MEIETSLKEKVWSSLYCKTNEVELTTKKSVMDLVFFYYTNNSQFKKIKTNICFTYEIFKKFKFLTIKFLVFFLFLSFFEIEIYLENIFIYHKHFYLYFYTLTTCLHVTCYKFSISVFLSKNNHENLYKNTLISTWVPQSNKNTEK